MSILPTNNFFCKILTFCIWTFLQFDYMLKFVNTKIINPLDEILFVSYRMVDAGWFFFFFSVLFCFNGDTASATGSSFNSSHSRTEEHPKFTYFVDLNQHYTLILRIWFCQIYIYKSEKSYFKEIFQYLLIF